MPSKSFLKKVKADPRISEFWDEGEDGMWANTKRGYINTENGCHAVHEWTEKAFLNSMTYIKPCNCVDCVPKKGK